MITRHGFPYTSGTIRTSTWKVPRSGKYPYQLSEQAIEKQDLKRPQVTTEYDSNEKCTTALKTTHSVGQVFHTCAFPIVLFSGYKTSGL